MKALWSNSRWHTAGDATPEQRVRALIRFPHSSLMRGHTIAQLLKDPATEPHVPIEVRHEARDWWYEGPNNLRETAR